MNKKYSLILGLMLFFLPAVLFAQTYNMTNGSVNTCSGHFYDANGSGGSYGNNQNYTETFCSNNGQSLQFDFNYFKTERNYDYLFVYDGPSTASPLKFALSGVGTSTQQLPPIASSGTCLTFNYTSDGSTTNTGWDATISCTANPSLIASD